MQHLKNARLSQKPTLVLSTVVFLGLSANLLQTGWEVVSRFGLAAAFFAAGILVAQHAAIWENNQTIKRKPDDKS